jgi:cyclophilin family peptidyl-prolyl cis-trans isomerase
MPDRRRTRERQLAKLAARRAAERRKKRRQRITAGTVGIAVALAGFGYAAFALTRGTKKPVAAPSPTASATATPSVSPSPSGSPGSNCGYVKTDEPTLESGPVPIPKFTINVNKHYTATMKTSMGTIVVKLLPKDAPCTVNSFVYLAKKHFYDGIIFHRIVKGFVDQTGDPQGSGAGGPGYKFNDELANSLTYDAGTVAMANSGPNTNGSQFFIVVDDGGKQLTKSYTIFGEVTKGMDVANKINAVPTAGTGSNPDLPKKTITIISLTIKVS